MMPSRNVHYNENVYKCADKECGKIFRSQTSLKFHIEKVHENIGPKYCCHLCKKRYILNVFDKSSVCNVGTKTYSNYLLDFGEETIWHHIWPQCTIINGLQVTKNSIMLWMKMAFTTYRPWDSKALIYQVQLMEQRKPIEWYTRVLRINYCMLCRINHVRLLTSYYLY